ncbi:hypothetical protein NKG05_17805 [Oerskovia sp. M15]
MTVNRSAAATEAGTGELLLLHLHNATAAKRWQTVGVSTLDASVALTVTAQSRCVAGKAQVLVRAVNDGDVKADVAVETAFGTKTFKNVAPGKSASQAFNSREVSIDAARRRSRASRPSTACRSRRRSKPGTRRSAAADHLTCRACQSEREHGATLVLTAGGRTEKGATSGSRPSRRRGSPGSVRTCVASRSRTF